MESSLTQIYQTLQKLIGFHRQLLETVRMEHEALVQADIRKIEDAVFAKQALIEAIQRAEVERMKALSELAMAWKKPVSELTLNNIVIIIQGQDIKFAEQFRSSLNALNLLIKRVSEQNKGNSVLVDKSLENIHAMKKNVLGESAPRTDVYNQKGCRSTGQPSSRLISKEV